MNFRLRSLQARIAARLALVTLIATALVVAVILYEGYQAADELGNGQLITRAEELARRVKHGPAGMANTDLPQELDQTPNRPAGADLILVQDEKGHIIAAAPPGFASAVRGLSVPRNGPTYFRLEQFGPSGQDYYGLRLWLNSAVGRIMVTVARASDADALAYALLQAFVRQIAWIIPMFAAATLAIAVWSIRRSLRPIFAISAQAAEISPSAITTRLSSDNLPSEIEPLVGAVNRALDRLAQGFAIQREFTANAAHELRTPLAILTAGLDNLDAPDSLEKLRSDATRMNRLVEQLLRVARLDSVPLDVGRTIDLRATVAEVVEYLAPWAVNQGRSLGFDGPEGVVLVRGSAEAINDAVRNIIENAVNHTGIGTEVTVSVTQDGAVSISDRGPGIAPSVRHNVFDRFWRGRDNHNNGAGLGLAIVAEIARAHNAIIDIDDAPDGGAQITLRFSSCTTEDGGFVGTAAQA